MPIISKIKAFFEPKPLTLFQDITLKLSEIVPMMLRDALSFDMMLKTLSVYDRSIIGYTQRLRRLTAALAEDKPLSPMMLPEVLVEIYLRDFFVDKEGYYVDIERSVEEFIGSCIDFTTTYEKREMEVNKSFTLERNLRLTQRILSNMASIAKGLSDGAGARQ